MQKDRKVKKALGGRHDAIWMDTEMTIRMYRLSRFRKVHGEM